MTLVTERKSDADRFAQFIKELGNWDWVQRSERRWWRKFVFHYTDIRNAAKVLREGYLYSRAYVEQHGGLAVTSGSPVVLAGTDDAVKDCVRLYFRPKTPAQFHHEGIYSRRSLEKKPEFSDAHCPVPIFFLFDSVDVLTRLDTAFSDGNLGSSRSRLYSTADEFAQLPWRHIYHNRSLDPIEGSNIVRRRCAEVVVPERLDLGALSYIYCRSVAERESLLFLLPPKLRKRYHERIVASTRSELYLRRQTFIETVRLTSREITIHFSPETKSPGPFRLRVEVRSESATSTSEKPDLNLAAGHTWRLRLPMGPSSYQVRVLLDEHLAYANRYEDLELPF